MAGPPLSAAGGGRIAVENGGSNSDGGEPALAGTPPESVDRADRLSESNRPISPVQSD